MRKLILLLVIMALFAMLIPITSAQGTVPHLLPESCSTFDVPTGFETECSYLVVPEEHANPGSGRTLQLGVVIYKSTSPTPAADPLIMAQGGPGGSTIDIYNQYFAYGFGNDLLATRDVILFDQRGTLYSQPSLACPELFDLTVEMIQQKLTLDEAEVMTLEALSQCRERLVSEGINLNAFDSVENAADVAALSQALNLESYNFYGVSYGTALAQHLLRDHPAGLRSVILDANVPLAGNFVAESPRTVQRSLDLIFAQCAADAECGAAFPTLEDDFYKLIQQLNANPLTIPLVNPETGESYNAVLDGYALLDGVVHLLYNAGAVMQIPKIIADLKRGETPYLQQVLPQILFDRTLNYGMYFSVECAEDTPATVGEVATENVRPEIMELMGIETYLAACEIWQVEALDAGLEQAVSSDIPVLILAGEFDPVTPPANGEMIASSLPNAYFYTFTAQSHGVFLSGNDCPDQIALSFLADPTQEPDATCITQLQPLEFAIPGVAPTLNLVPVEIESMGVTVSTVVPDGWNELFPGTYADAGGITAVLVQALPMAMPLDAMLQNLTAQFGMEAAPVVSTTLEANGLTWSIVDPVEVQGATAVIALAGSDSATYLVLMQAPADQIAALQESLLRPMLEAFVVK